MNTSYDEIFECFLQNCGADTFNLPPTDDGKYSMIHNAIRHYKNRTGYMDSLTWDDTTESVNTELNDDQLLILGYCIKLVYHEKALTEFTSIYATFQKEIGFKFYKEQRQARLDDVTRTENKIDELINNTEDYTF